nr:hypothetical protein [Tanacetum cinerariifolium]
MFFGQSDPRRHNGRLYVKLDRTGLQTKYEKCIKIKEKLEKDGGVEQWRVESSEGSRAVEGGVKQWGELSKCMCKVEVLEKSLKDLEQAREKDKELFEEAIEQERKLNEEKLETFKNETNDKLAEALA